MKYFFISFFFSCLCTSTFSQDLVKVKGIWYEVEILKREGNTLSFYELDDPNKMFRTLKMRNVENVYFEEYAERHFSFNFKFNFTAYGTNRMLNKYLEENKGTKTSPSTGTPDNDQDDLFGTLEDAFEGFRIPLRFGMDFDYCFNERFGIGNFLEFVRTGYTKKGGGLFATTWSFTPHVRLSDRWHGFHILAGPAFSIHTFKNRGRLRDDVYSWGLFTGMEVDFTNESASFARFHFHLRYGEKVKIGPFQNGLPARKYNNVNVVLGVTIGKRSWRVDE